MNKLSGSSLALATRRVAPALVLGAIYLGVGLATRLLLWASFGTAADVPESHLPMVLLAGLVNDAVESLHLVTPLALYLLLLPDRWYRSAINRALLATGFVLTISGFVFLAVAEYFFFEEFDPRFNLVAFDYLVYPAEVFVDIWEAYPVVPGVIGSLALAGIVTWALRRWLLPVDQPDSSLRQRLAPFAVHASLLIVAIAWYPTNAMSWSSNRVENELLQNGYSSFLRAAETNEIDYHAYYASRDPASNLKLLAGALGAGGGQFTRLEEGRSAPTFRFPSST